MSNASVCPEGNGALGLIHALVCTEFELVGVMMEGYG